jgi:hypothetical protein
MPVKFTDFVAGNYEGFWLKSSKRKTNVSFLSNNVIRNKFVSVFSHIRDQNYTSFNLLDNQDILRRYLWVLMISFDFQN